MQAPGVILRAVDLESAGQNASPLHLLLPARSAARHLMSKLRVCASVQNVPCFGRSVLLYESPSRSHDKVVYVHRGHFVAQQFCRGLSQFSIGQVEIVSRGFVASSSAAILLLPFATVSSNSPINSRRALNKRLARDSPRLPSVVGRSCVKNSRFWQ